MKEFKYKSNNKSFKIISEKYPFTQEIIGNIVFHILDDSHDVDSLNELINEYYSKFDESDEDDDYEYEYENDINILYDNYAECVVDYFENILGCDVVFGYKLLMYTDDYYDIEELMAETDLSKFKKVIVGIIFTNSIDRKLYIDYKNELDDNSIGEAIYYLKTKNLDIIESLGYNKKQLMESLSDFILQLIIKYVKSNEELYENKKINIEVNDSTVEVGLCTAGFFDFNEFVVSTDISKYISKDNMLKKYINNILDDIYRTVIVIMNATIVDNIDKFENVEIFKYHNDEKTCIFIKNDIGGIYLYADGFNKN